MKILAAGLLAMLVLLPLAFASTQESEYTLESGKVLVNHLIKLTYTVSELSLSIPKDADLILIYADGKEIPNTIEQQTISKRVKISIDSGVKEVKIEYYTKQLLEKPKNTFFVADVVALVDSDVSIKVILPEKAALTEPISNGTGSIYPKPSKVGSDGTKISFYWENKGMKASQAFPILIEYTEEASNAAALLGILAIFIILIPVFLVLNRKKKTEKKPIVNETVHKKPENEKPEKSTYDAESHLKEDELAVINVLKLKNGSTTQSTLRIATGFSKATLSRLLMELEQRKIIVKEKKGNKNLIILKSSVWNNLEQ